MKKEWRKELRAIIKSKGLTLAEVSKRLTGNEGYLKVMLARNNEPGLGTLQKICDELNIPISSLIEDVPADLDAISIARAFADLSNDDKAAVKRMVAALANQAEQK